MMLQKNKLFLHFIFSSIILLITISGCRQKVANKVVVYVTTDQAFSEPTLRDFGKETEIQFKAVYDTEGLKEGKPVVLGCLADGLHNLVFAFFTGFG